MRVIVRRDPTTGASQIIVRGSLPHEGEFVQTFNSNIVPIVEIESGVQAEIFIPSDADVHSAKDFGDIRPMGGLSVWRGKVPADRR